MVYILSIKQLVAALAFEFLQLSDYMDYVDRPEDDICSPLLACTNVLKKAI